MVIKTFAFLAFSCLLLASQQTSPNKVPMASVCDLRQRPDEFGGKAVRVAGWIYTDIERFGLEESNCGVALKWLEHQEKTKDTQMKKFAKLLKESKRNAFETDGRLFTILQGKFETSMVRKNGQLVMSGSGYGGGAGSAPSIIVIQKVVCSVNAPASTTTKTQASKLCQK